MRILEVLLVLGILVGLLMRDFLSIQFEGLIFIFGTLSGFLYLFGYWWLNKSQEKNIRTIFITLLYGFSFACCLFSLVFQWVYLQGADQLSVLSFIFIGLTIGLDRLLLRQSKVLNQWGLFRIAIYSVLILVYLFIPKEKRIMFSYRNDPEFLKYYEANKENKEFQDLRDEYFHKSE